MTPRNRTPLTTTLTLLITACGILGPDLDTTGTVHYRDLEGGCWVIETSERVLSPTNLAPDFRVDGLYVRFEADFRNDLDGFCPGAIVELKRIERA